MFNLLPEFVQDAYKKNIFSGIFEAVTMFMDISGFTVITEKLMENGKEGAEILNIMLNKLFSPIIDSVYNKGGFITRFAGDAFTAIFPIDNENLFNTEETNSNILTKVDYKKIVKNVCYSALSIKNIVKLNKVQKTKFGDFGLSVKIGISSGQVDWGIVGHKGNMDFYFKGEAIDGCAESEHQCDKMDIYLDIKTYLKLTKSNIDNDKKFIKLKDNSNINYNIPQIPYKPMDIEVARNFIPDVVIDYNHKGEFRNIVSIFISFKDFDDYTGLNYFLSSLLENVEKYNAYLETIDFGDKGGICLIVFGLPYSYENDLERALSFIQSLNNEFNNNIRTGITMGNVFVGMKGSERRAVYGVLGSIVNLSARLSMKANWGEIILCEKVNKNINKDYKIENLGKIKLKGIKNETNIYKLGNKINIFLEKDYENILIGRDNELLKIKNIINLLFKNNNNKFAGIIYIYGDAGSGKTRLAKEVFKIYKDDLQIFTLQPDIILKDNLNPFLYFFYNYFRQAVPKKERGKRILFETIFNEFLENLKEITKSDIIIENLKKEKEIIAGFIGLKTNDEVYENLDSKNKLKSIIIAFKIFFISQTYIKPTVIFLENLHEFDKTSKLIFKLLTQKINNYPLVIIATSRYNDDGTKPFIVLDKDIRQYVINLEKFDEITMNEFIEKVVGRKVDNNLLNFINERTEGNPFYVEQFCLYLQEHNLLEVSLEKDSQFGIYTLKYKNTEDIPLEVNNILIARLDRLPKKLKDIAQIVSVFGMEFDVNVLFKVIKNIKNIIPISFNETEIITLLNLGERENLWSNSSKTCYIFNSQLLRDITYEMQLKSKIRQIHECIGDTLAKFIESGYKDKYYRIVYHYKISEKENKQKLYLEGAGDYAKESYENEKAIIFYEELLKYSDIDNNSKIRVNIKIGEVYEYIGKWDKAEEIYKNIITNITDEDDKKLVADLKYAFANLIVKKGNYNEFFDIMKETENIYKELKYEKDVIKVLNKKGNIYFNIGNRDEALKYFNEALNISKNINYTYGFGRNLIGIATVYSIEKKDYDKAMNYLKKALEIFEKLNLNNDIANVLEKIGNIYLYKSKYTESIKFYEKSIKIYEKIKNKESKARVLDNMGTANIIRGNYDTALNLYEQALEIAEDLSYSKAKAIISNNIGEVYKYKKNYNKAMDYYDTAIEEAKEINLKYELSEFMKNKAELFYILNNISMSEEFNNEALRLSNDTKNMEILFYSKILEAKINFIKDKEKGNEQLENILRNTTEKEKIAFINYTLSILNKNTGNNEKYNYYKKFALKLYDELYKKSYNYNYKAKMKELEK